jgi:hypothetical protein
VAHDHFAGLRHDFQIGFVGPVGFAHVREFHQRVDVGHLHVAINVRRRVARIVFDRERRLVRANALDRPDWPGGAVEFAFKGDGLAPVGIVAGGLTRGAGVGEVFGNNRRRSDCAFRPAPAI